ncbi:hypothetical protein [Streptomyces sp. NPDC002467]|uniref:hypothetical protein n=1 Tax=Streptomyces sp. NPDC002467 TaxID=3364647 RepID=UPI0036ADB6C7
MSQGSRTETEDESNRAAVTAPRVVLSELVPEGRALIPVQAAGRVYIAVRPDAELEQVVRELNDHIEHAYAVGYVVPYNAQGESRERPAV